VKNEGYTAFSTVTKEGGACPDRGPRIRIKRITKNTGRPAQWGYFTRKDPLVERIRKNAIITASRFTAEAEKESVLGFWKTYLEAIQ